MHKTPSHSGSRAEPSELVKFRFCNIIGAQARVRAFNDSASQELVGALVPNEKYSNISWDVTKQFIVKGLKSQFRLHFVSLDAKVGRGGFEGDPLAEPFIEFAKAYIRFRHVKNPVSYSATNRRIFGLRCVEAAFRDLDRSPEIWRLDPHVLARAVELGAAGKTAATAYKIGLEIQGLYEFCREMHFLSAAFTWSQSVPYPGKRSAKVGDESKRYCAKEFLNIDEIRASGEGHAPLAWADQVYSCVAVLLTNFPIKAHELLQLRVNPEVEVTEVGEDGQQRTYFGLQIWPGKGDVPKVKWVSKPENATSAKQAVQLLREMLTPARSLAHWYEQNPNKLYLPPHLEHLRRAGWLVVSDVQEILGVSKSATRRWIDVNGIDKRIGGRRVTRGRGHGKDLAEVRFGDVERKILSLLPKDFPYVNGDSSGHRYSEALLVVPTNALHASWKPWRCMFEAVGYEQFHVWLRNGMNSAPPAADEATAPPTLLHVRPCS